MQQDLLILIQSWQEQVPIELGIDLIPFCLHLSMLFQLFGAEKLRMQRLLIAKLVQEGIAIGAPPEAIQAPENDILAYDY